jgi:hypothetical protein
MSNDPVLEVVLKVIVSVASTFAVAALTLLFKSVRGVIFYTRAEYDLTAERKPGESPFKRSWSINWEDNRLDLEAGNISNNNVAAVVFKNAVGKKHSVPDMHPSNDFIDIFDGALGVKINSIVRQDRPSDDDTATYTLRFVVRRKRWS